jgi:hypothetical protein
MNRPAHHAAAQKIYVTFAALHGYDAAQLAILRIFACICDIKKLWTILSIVKE